jgi:hypothetical protein
MIVVLGISWQVHEEIVVAEKIQASKAPCTLKMEAYHDLASQKERERTTENAKGRAWVVACRAARATQPNQKLVRGKRAHPHGALSHANFCLLSLHALRSIQNKSWEQQ